MKIWIDGKNLALYTSGISHWTELITNGIELEKGLEFQIIYPAVKSKDYLNRTNFKALELPWFGFLPSKLSHLIYDNFTFRIYARIKKPDLIFSPYYDVILPKKIKGIVSIHDLCYIEAKSSYSFFRRTYFMKTMKRNLAKSHAVVTVSQNTRNQLIERMGVPANEIHVIPMTLSSEFRNFIPDKLEIAKFREQYGQNKKLILYTSGLENRKNVPFMLHAIATVTQSDKEAKLIVTGRLNRAWNELLAKYPVLEGNVFFTGYLSTTQLKTAYSSADLVIFPSLSEGYGNACVESMNAGATLICSDIPIFHEIAGNYATYFDPLDVTSLEAELVRALAEKKLTTPSQQFLGEGKLSESFLSLIKGFEDD
jgi:glycosyltransferase involved in cell wall biosynthesis